MGLFLRVLRKSCEGSSMKALPRMVKASTRVQRCLWILALLGGLAAACYQLARLFIGYFNYSTSVNIAEVQGTPPFPDVTVCHVDPMWSFKKLEEALQGELSYSHYLNRISKLKEQYEENSMESIIVTELGSIGAYLQNVKEVHLQGQVLQNLLIVECVVNTDWELDRCFKEHNSSVKSTVFLDPVFGMCVTFQVPQEAAKGLDLVLYMDDQQTQMIDTFNMLNQEERLHISSTGAKVVIHPRGSFPDIWLASHTIQAGTQVSFVVEGTKRSVLGEPYGSCVTPEDSKNAKNMPGFSLNRHGYECYRMCAKDYVLLDCGCLHYFYTLTKEERETYNLCAIFDEKNMSVTMSRMRCAIQVITELADSSTMYEKCKCPTPCKQFVYEYNTEELKWPHHTFHLSFYKQYIRDKSIASKFEKYENLLTLSETDQKSAQAEVSKLDLINRNFAEVKILNRQKTYFHYSETPLISPEALFGNLGGILNLWAGITFITVIEIVEFVHQLLISKQKSREEQRNLQKAEPNNL